MSFETALPFILAREGGRVDDPADPGGRTNFGITQRTWDAWLAAHPDDDLPSDVWDALPDEVAPLYQTNYWDAAGCGALSDGPALALFDTAVNCGVSRAVDWWKHAAPNVDQFLTIRENYYETLAHNHPSLQKFLAGWLKRITLLRAAISVEAQ